MLSTDAINAELGRLTYKDGWSFKCYDDPHEGQKVRIVAKGLPDSYNPGETIDLGVDSFLPPVCDEWDLRRWLAWRLKRIEIHESLEFLRLDGQVLWDPHRV